MPGAASSVIPSTASQLTQPVPVTSARRIARCSLGMPPYPFSSLNPRSQQALHDALERSNADHDDLSLSSLLLALLRQHCLSSHTPDNAAYQLLAQLHQHATSTESQSIVSDCLLDAIWSFDLELESRNDLAASESAAAQPPSLALHPHHPLPLALARQTLAALVADLLSAAVLAEDHVSERLEHSLLALVGLIPNEVYFNKRSIQLRTARLFKQQKFNLLREENQGYTALITEIVTNLGPPTIAVRHNLDPATQAQPQGSIFAPDSASVIEQESPALRNRRAARVMNNIQALIGYFDLDANRVLDLILDLFATEIIRHYPFFLALLSHSPWANADANPASASSANASATNLFADVNLDLSLDSGDRICAQLLGFKFAHYAHPDTKDATPDELYLLAALLIKIGIVRLVDLYPHLSPSQDGMRSLQTKHRQALAAKASTARANALSMAAPLTDDADPSSKFKDGTKAKDEAPAKDPPNQVVGLVRAMLSLGDLRHALFLLTRYPWLCSAFNEVADPFIRLLNVIVQPAYDEISFSRMNPPCAQPSILSPRPRWDPKSQAATRPAVKSLVLTRKVPEPAPSLSCQHVFFYPHWTDSLPVCRSLDDVLRILVPLLKVLGASLSRDAALFQKVCRLTKVGYRLATTAAAAATSNAQDPYDDFDEPQEDSQSQSWFDLLRFHLLPALSLSPSNSGLVDEVWMLVRIMPYDKRFSLYGQWKYDLYQLPELRAAQAATEKEAKGILKRISKDNIKQSGRNLAKASHSNPTIFFTVALNQIQAYDNLIQPLVESAKYLSQFEYDIFAFNLVDALSNPEKERTKQDGTNISLWLKSLAAFCGTLYRRYAMMDCTPVLQYLVNQLKANNSKDLVIMSELITKMSGIEPLANLADAQIAALTGGRHLHMEAMMAANALTGSKERLAFRRSGQRLLHALVESKLSVPLLILVAQQRQACIHLVPESEAHLKYLGNLYDSCQEVLLQYVEFLFNHLDTAEYASLVPSLQHLCVRFGIEPAIAFYIARPKLVHSMKQTEAADAAERLRAELTASRAKTKAAEDDKAPAQADAAYVLEETAEAADKANAADQDGDVDMEEAAAPSPTKDAAGDKTEVDAVNKELPDSKLPSPAPIEPWHRGLIDAIHAAKDMLPESALPGLGVHFYVTFWQLSLADISVPIERYQQEVKRLNAVIRETAAEDQRKRLQDNVGQLNAEMKDQMKSHEVTRKRLQAEKNHWFVDAADRGAIVAQLIQYCLFPRALLSPTDAIFAGKFVRTVHNLGTRNFSSLTAYDKIFVDHVAAIIFSSTENEARNYSRFLYTVLADLSPWHRQADIYAKEAIGQKLPGFQMRWQDRHGGEEIPKADLLTWDQFRLIFCKWQDCLQRAFKTCLSSKEYMRTRNSIIVMTRISPFYPLIDSHGTEISAIVESLAANEQRGDLKILAQGLLATLKARAKSWLPLHQARKVANPPAPAAATETADDSKAAPTSASAKVDGDERKQQDKAAPTSAGNDAKSSVRAQRDPAPPASTNINGRSSDRASEKTPAPSAAGSRLTAPPTAPGGRGNTATKVPPSANLPSRPGGAPQKAAALESKDRRGGAASSQADGRRGEDRGNARQEDASRRGGGERTQGTVPAGPRNDASRDNGLPSRPSREPNSADSRSRGGASNSDRATTAQASRDTADAKGGVDAMNPPTGPASTTSAQAVRNRAERDRNERSSSASLPAPNKDKDTRDRNDRQGDRDKTRNAERDRERERERERERDRDRRDRDRSARDRDREREKDRERERELALRDRERARDRDRGGNARDRDDRKRSGGRSGQPSRNATPVRDLPDGGGGRESGSTTPLGPRRDREREQAQRPRDRDRESAAATPTSARSTPGVGAPEEISIRGGAKRNLVDRLGGASPRGASPAARAGKPDAADPASGWDTPNDASGWDTDEPAKRIKIDRNQKYAPAGPPSAPAAESQRNDRRPQSSNSNRNSFGGGRDRRDGGRDQRRDRSARRAGNE
ncbi:hypothetical protein PaG_04350 [Moesziomyces aphidis]|uniref:THO complex subunit 2 n=1 Tax=Moesziomyces aphidis TaxID=84754 RepID=W3VIJ9_MOEAP|nr:hypothetical protein PaG_04350 [Moesziomyces aphidis]